MPNCSGSRRADDRMVIGFTITYSMESAPITTNVVGLIPTQARCTRFNIMW